VPLSNKQTSKRKKKDKENVSCTEEIWKRTKKNKGYSNRQVAHILLGKLIS